MKSRKPRRYGIARLVLSFVVALLIIDALGALGYGTTTGSCCFIQEPGDPGSGNPGGGGPAPTPTATPDPLSPWDTYPRQGFSDEQVATYSGDFGVKTLWFHGYVNVTGNIMELDTYSYDINNVVSEIVVTHGSSAPFAMVPNVWEYIYGSVNNNPVISINGTLDGCENPYPTPEPGGCIHGELPSDPFGSNSDDFAYSNYASFPLYPVFYSHGMLDMSADVLPGDDGASELNTHNAWKHRVVYPAVGS